MNYLVHVCYAINKKSLECVIDIYKIRTHYPPLPYPYIKVETLPFYPFSFNANTRVIAFSILVPSIYTLRRNLFQKYSFACITLIGKYKLCYKMDSKNKFGPPTPSTCESRG